MKRLLSLLSVIFMLAVPAYSQVLFDYNPPPTSASQNTKRLDLDAELDGINAEKTDFVDIDTSSELRGILTDETGTGSLMFGLTTTMADNLGCTADQFVARDATDTAFTCVPGGGGGGLASADIDTSVELRGIMTDELGTGVLFFLGAPAADDQAFISSSVSAGAWTSIPDSDAATQKLQYDVTTNQFSVGTDDDIPEIGDLGVIDTSSEFATLLTDEVAGGDALVFAGTPADDQVSVGDSAVNTTWRAIPDSDAATQKLQYDVTTNQFSAGTDDDVPEIGDLGVIDTSTELQTLLTDEIGTGVLFFLGAPASGDQVFISDSASAGTWQSIPDSDSPTQKLQYDITTNVFSAGTDDDSPESGDIQNNTVDLGTHTVGNYVGDVTAGTGVAVTGASGENATKVVAFDFGDAGADPAIGADECRFTNNATVERYIVCEGNVADALETGIAFVAPTSTDKVMTIPDANSNPVQPFTCTGSDKISGISTAGVITCATDEGGAGSGDNLRIEVGDNGGTFTAVDDLDLEDSGDINFTITEGTPDSVAATVRADSVALTTDTTGNYAAGDAEAGAALTGDTATSFFSAGTIEVARGGTGAAPGAGDQVPVSDSSSGLTWRTIPDIDPATQKLAYDVGTNTFSAETDDDVPEAADIGNDTVTLTTDTTGNYALGDAEGGAATTGDSATAFFSAGSLEDARMTLKTESFCLALSDETTALTTGTNKTRFVIPYAFVVTGVSGSLSVVSSSGTPTFDINEDPDAEGATASASIISTKITIDVNERRSSTAAVAPVISDANLAANAEIQFDIDVAGTGAAGGKACIIGHQ